MRSGIKIDKNNQNGIAHLIVPVTVIVLTAIAGTAWLVKTHADSPAASSTTTSSCFTTGSKTVTGAGVGSYFVSPDNWGGGNACISTDGKADFTINSQSVGKTGNVLGYPNINAGCGAITGSGCTPNWVNKKVSNLGVPEETWVTAGSTNSAAEYDVADDIWFAPSATSGCPHTELLIMINGKNLAPPPKTTVSINNIKYYYKNYTQSSSGCTWNYIQFRRVNTVSSMNGLKLMPFFNYAVSHNLLSSSDYLRQVGAGFEYWSYGAGLKTTNFSLTE